MRLNIGLISSLTRHSLLKGSSRVANRYRSIFLPAKLRLRRERRPQSQPRVLWCMRANGPSAVVSTRTGEPPNDTRQAKLDVLIHMYLLDLGRMIGGDQGLVPVKCLASHAARPGHGPAVLLHPALILSKQSFWAYPKHMNHPLILQVLLGGPRLLAEGTRAVDRLRCNVGDSGLIQRIGKKDSQRDHVTRHRL